VKLLLRLVRFYASGQKRPWKTYSAASAFCRRPSSPVPNLCPFPNPESQRWQRRESAWRRQQAALMDGDGDGANPKRAGFDVHASAEGKGPDNARRSASRDVTSCIVRRTSGVPGAWRVALERGYGFGVRRGHRFAGGHTTPGGAPASLGHGACVKIM
jgi:hypothetical protein